MAFDNEDNLEVYLQDGTTVQMQNPAIVTNRAPTATDAAEIGDTWIDTTAQAAYTLCAITGAGSVWQSNAGAITAAAMTINPGNLLVSAGNITATVGDIAAGGNITCTDITTGGAGIIGTTLQVIGATTLADLAITGDFDLTTAAQFDVTTTLDAASAIYLHANGGVSETINIRSEQGTGADALTMTASVGGMTITTGLASDDSFNIASSGGVDIDAAMQINVATSETDANSFTMISAGGMDITVTGAAAKDIDVTCTSGSINITAGESDADAMILNASGAAGGVKIQAGTNGVEIGNQADCSVIDVGDFAPTASRTITIGGGTVITAAVTDTIDIGVDGATTNANSIKTVNVATGGVTLGENNLNLATGNRTSGTHLVNVSTGTGTKVVNVGNADGLTTVNVDGITLINDSINVQTSINSGTSTGAVVIGNALAGAVTIDTAAGISLDAATASNFTVTGAVDLTLASVGGSVVVDGSEAAVDAISLTASDVAGGLDFNAGTGGVTLDTTGSFSIDSAANSNITLTGAFDLTVSSTAGSIIVDGGEAVADAVQITASDVAGGITLTSGTGGITSVNTGALSLACTLASDITCTGADLTLESVGASVNVTADEAANDAIALDATAGGFSVDGILESSITVTGASEDLNLMAVGGSVYIDGSEAVTNAVRIISTGVGGGIDIDANTGGLFMDSAGAFSIDGAVASNVTVTGAGIDLTLSSVGGSVLVSSDEAVATAVRIVASDPAGGISIEGDGLTHVEYNNQTIASPAVIATSDTNAFQILCTGFTTASAAVETFTITNALVTTASTILTGCCNEGANDAQMTITRVQRLAGSFVVTVTNNGAAALNGNMSLNFWVL